ncbi:alpha/beta fold hydrolase [Hydrogenophaga sp. R2]|uniref:alpha/beta fold hydrolase n=1 Tax=Hydrogenophaga sp. R2 TaxID=3132827 RepID=UPI003CF05EC2
MRRRQFHAVISALTGSALGAFACPGLAQPAGPKIGVLLLHGKNPGSNQDPSMTGLQAAFGGAGWKVLFPDMPWSRNRYLEGDWDQAMLEIASHVKALQDQGAERIVLAGHSMGVPASLSFAARGGTVHALVLLAPGHVPRGYYTVPALKPVRESIDEARALVAAGKGDSVERFTDINQGRRIPVATTARKYLTWFDPESDADMGVTAPRVPASVPVFTAIGESDPLFKGVRGYFVDKLPANPRSQFVEVGGGHLDTPGNVREKLMTWIPAAVA